MKVRHHVSPRSSGSSTKTARRKKKSGGSSAASSASARSYRRLKFGSKTSLRRSLAPLRLTPGSVHSMLTQAARDSAPRAGELANAILAKRMRVGETREAVRGLVKWGVANAADLKARQRSICKAFRARRADLLLIHGISELAPDASGPLMKTYVEEGGNVAAVAEWLAIAGAVIARHGGVPAERVVARAARSRRPMQARRQALGLGDWFEDAADAVGDFIEDAWDSATNAVASVIAAVKWAGMSVASAVAAAANWTVAQATDLVRALLAAGEAVADILAQALANGTLAKFVRAVLGAGRSVASVLVWAATRTLAAMNTVVSAILAAGRSIYDVLAWAAGQVAAMAQKVVQALLNAGRTVAQVMADAVRLAAAGLRKVVGVLIAAGRKAAEIIAAVARTTASVIRTVLEGLFMVGVQLAETILAICTGVVEQFRKGFLQGLVALGHAVVDILKAALLAGASILALAFAAALELFGGHRALTAAEIAEARRVFGWSIELQRVKVAVSSYPADFVNWVNGERPFTTMYVINFASWDHITMSTLIHELTHVWQAATSGPIYMVEALHSQQFGRGYEVTDADIAAANGDLRNLQREQQAVVVQRYWEGRWGGINWDWAKYEPLARDVYRARPGVTIPLLAELRPVLVPVTRRVTGVLPIAIQHAE